MNFTLTSDDDQHIWKHDISGFFSSKMAYKAFFYGSIQFEPWRHLWKSWAPAKCKRFLWLSIKSKCWTADQLTKRGLPHPDKCILYDQEEETIQHILTTCVFAIQFWHSLLSPLNLQQLVPNRREHSFATWWRKITKRVGKQHRKGVNSLTILGAWTMWKHRNACVFDGDSATVSTSMRNLQLEGHL